MSESRQYNSYLMDLIFLHIRIGVFPKGVPPEVKEDAINHARNLGISLEVEYARKIGVAS